MGCAVASQAAIIWNDDFDTDTSANYVSRNYSTVSVTPDTKTYFNFDFGGAWPYDELTYTEAVAHSRAKAAIPSAPGTSSTKALYFRVNEDQAETTSVEIAWVHPKDLYIFGDYTATWDMWYETTTSGTSTQGSLYGLEWRGPKIWSQELTGPGYQFSVIGDGSSSQDYRCYKGSFTQLGSLGNGGWGASVGTGGTGSQPFQNNNNSWYNTYFTVASGSYIAGTPSGQWTKVELKRNGSNISHKLFKTGDTTGLLINSINDDAYYGGVPMLGMWDPAGSPRPSNQPIFCLYDNFQIDGTLGALVTGKWTPGELYDITLPESRFKFPQAATATIVDGDGTTVLGKSSLYFVDAEGNYELVVPANKQGFICFKYSNWLSKKVAFDTTGGNQTGLDFTSLNGDCNGDDFITTDDYLIISEHFDTFFDPLDPNNGFDARGDLNYEGNITTDDYLILSNNFDLAGDCS